MYGFVLKGKIDQKSARHVKKIIETRATLVKRYSSFIKSLDEVDPNTWGQIIAAAQEAGLEKEQLCNEFSCAWSTVLRWQAGRNAPAIFTRRAMKQRLLEMLKSLHEAELERSRELMGVMLRP